MKKFTILLTIFLFVHSFCLYADDVESFENDPLEIGNKKPFGIQDRSFEIGLAHLDFNLANNFLSIKEIFQDVVVIDIDKLADGFLLNFGLNITPFYFSFKSKKGWGLGLSTNAEALGILGLSGNMLSISQAVNDNSDISGALFASATINAFFNLQKFKIKVNPSLFYTLAYLKSDLIYTLNYEDGTVLCVDYDMRLYTGFPIGEDADSSGLTSMPGLDFSVGVEYPLAKEIGLSSVIPFLDFDLSLDLINIPFIPSTMTDYMRVNGRIGSDEPISFFNDDGADFFSSFDTTSNSETGKGEIKVNRPFKLIVHADWRPLFGSKLLTVTPLIGFCYNDLYNDPFSLEIGINAGLNFANFFLVKAGFNYKDRMFINSLNLAFNIRAFELDIGADLRSQTAAQSWTGNGFGLTFGLKFGW